MRIIIFSRINSGNFAALILLASGLIAPLTCIAQNADASPRADTASSQSGAAKKTRAVGTIESVSGNVITLRTEAGSAIAVVTAPTTRLMRLEPAQTDLKSAPTIQLSEVLAGDRLAAAGVPSGDGKSLAATSAVVMKKSDVAGKQEHDREEWQKHGVGGVVKSVDTAAQRIMLSSGTLGNASALGITLSKQTVVRRYSPDSVKFDDAQLGTLDQIKEGDQLRARGTKSADGKELAAAEIVSGAFRSIAGLVVAADAANHTLTVNDLASKRPVTLKIGSDSQMHQLPAMFAQRIAMRLKGGAAADSAGAPATGGASAHSPRKGPAAGAPAPAQSGEGPGDGGGRPGGPPDFQQMLSRMPALTLRELQKGDALMIVATEGTPDSPSTVIIMLGGVEPILTAASPSQASTILSPWNLSAGSNAGSGDAP